jgi:hypothetical protein
VKWFVRVFLGVFLLEVGLFGVAAVSPDSPVVDNLIVPAYSIALLVPHRGVGPPGYLSIFFGITVTSLLCALLVRACLVLVSKVLSRKTQGRDAA